MKTIVICFLLCFNITLHAQLIDLNLKNGFKEFTFGDSRTKWQKDLGYFNAQGGDEYIGTCCHEILDFKAERIYLYFENDKLYRIMIFIKIPDYDNNGCIITSDVSTAINSISSYFGKPSNYKMNGVPFQAEWSASKINVWFYWTNIGDDLPYDQFPAGVAGKYISLISIMSNEYLNKQSQMKF